MGVLSKLSSNPPTPVKRPPCDMPGCDLPSRYVVLGDGLKRYCGLHAPPDAPSTRPQPSPATGIAPYCESPGCDQPTQAVDLPDGVRHFCREHTPAFARPRGGLGMPHRTALAAMARAIWQRIGGNRDTIEATLALAFGIAERAPGVAAEAYHDGAELALGCDPFGDEAVSLIDALVTAAQEASS